MSLSSLTTWEVRPTNGNDVNGGAFVNGASGTDFSQQNAKNTVGNNISTTDAVGNGTTTLTSATASFTAAIVGNVIHLSGTGFTTGWYQVTVFTNGTTVTIDRSPGTGTGGAMNIGGALQTLGQLNTNMAAGMAGWVKAEATITVSAAAINWTFNATNFAFVAGYTSVRGDLGQVTIQATSGTNYTLMSLSNNGSNQTTYIRNFILDCNTKTGVVGFVMTGGGTVGQNITVINQAGGTCFSVNNNGATAGTLIDCVAKASDNVVGFDSISANLQSLFLRCVATGLTSTAGASIPFRANEGNFIRCIAANNPGSSSDGFFYNSSGRTILFLNCIAYKNGRDGFRLPAALPTYPVIIQNCIIYGNTGWGIDNPNATSINPGGATFSFNAVGANTAGAATGLTLEASCQTLTADPFVAGTSNNFALNTTAGGGALCRALGFAGVLPTGGQGYIDIGALQHQDPAGGGGMLFIPNLEGT